MTALVSFDRIFEVLDLKPLVGGEAGRDRHPARGRRAIEFEHVDFSYPTAAEVSLASLESVAVLDQAPSSQVLHDVSFAARPGELVALVGPSGAGKTTISQLVPRLYDVRAGAVRINGHRHARTSPSSRCAAMIGVVTQDAHLFHDTIRANLALRRPDATEAELVEALAGGADPALRAIPARRPRHGRRRPRVPALRRREAADRDRPAAAQGARHRRPRRGDRPPRLGVRGRRPGGPPDRARRADLDRHRPPALDDPPGGPDPRRGRGPDRGAGHPRRAARRRRALRRAVPDAVRRPGDRGHAEPARRQPVDRWLRAAATLVAHHHPGRVAGREHDASVPDPEARHP